MRARTLITPVLASVASFGAAAGATAALSTSSSTPSSSAGAKTVTVTSAKAPRGATGPTGRTGRTGPKGPTGTQGAAGPGVIVTPISINWQNNEPDGRSSVDFTAPGIGTGTITCTPNIEHVTDSGKQTIEFTPTDQDADTTMGLVRVDDHPFTYYDDPARAAEKPIAVKFAHRERFTGPKFNEGFNLKAFSATYRAQGTMTGIISQRGKRGAIGGPVAVAPTTFRLSWHWQFDDGNPRCYVAGAFFKEAT